MNTQQDELVTILETCKEWIAKGQTEKALKLLVALKDAKLQRTFTNLSNQYNSFEKLYQKGSLTTEERSASRIFDLYSGAIKGLRGSVPAC